jgi:hypothetical protein
MCDGDIVQLTYKKFLYPDDPFKWLIRIGQPRWIHCELEDNRINKIDNLLNFLIHLKNLKWINKEIIYDLVYCLNQEVETSYLKWPNKYIHLGTIDKKKILKFYGLCVYFGADIDNSNPEEDEVYVNCLELIEVTYNINLEKLKIKIRAGRKIAKFIKDALNDEFEMKPLRTKIDLRKFEDLIKK